MPAKLPAVTRPGPSGTLAKITDYAALVRAVRQELDELDVFIRRRTAEAYWRVGKFIHEHLLEGRERSDHGSHFFEKLAEDVGRDASTLSRCLQFNRAYPILAARQELAWGHYRALMTVRDRKERDKLEAKIVRENWDTRQFEEYLRNKRALETARNGDRPVPRLKVTRGRLGVYKVTAVAAPGFEDVLIDHGFGVLRPFPGGASRGFKDGDLIESVDGGYRKTDTADELRYTYRTRVERVVDGDTLLVLIEGGGGNFVRQRLRLRGIDCPELDTAEGKRAKRFVEKKLEGCPFVVIRTYKERKDLHARYLGDVFYLSGGDHADAGKAAADGHFLNQDLLDARLAVPFP